MKIPSFIKLPNHKKFIITPRHYDTIKEEIAERTEMIRKEMSGEEHFGTRSSRITFDRRSSQGPLTSGLQLVIAAILGLFVLGWLYFGNQIGYILWLALPVYGYFKFRKKAPKT